MISLIEQNDNYQFNPKQKKAPDVRKPGEKILIKKFTIFLKSWLYYRWPQL